MRRVLLAAAAALAGAWPVGAVDVGRPAPGFVGHDSAGKPVALEAFRGRTVVLEWTNDGCPYVRHMYASGVMQRLQRDAAGQGVVWLTVISSAPGKQGFLDCRGAAAWKATSGAASADVILDPSGEVGRLYDARTTPDMFVIDRSGRLVYAGAIDDRPSTEPADAEAAHNYVEAALADLKESRPVAPAVTVSYGCSVKYR